MLSELLRPGNGDGGRDNRFIVELTPTALDFSGTMDKTVAEIYEALQAGKEIWASIAANGGITYLPISSVWEAGSYAYPSFNFYMVYNDADMLIIAATGATNNGDSDAYMTNIYPLTPLSM